MQERQHALGCQAPEGVSAQPRSIEQTVQLANSLPKPLSLACFVEALQHPLHLHASRSEVSAQPAIGTRSPRIFIYLESLVLTVVPAGRGAHLLEMGELRPDHRSLKAELPFPLADSVTAEQPFEYALYDERLTACAFCHASEEREPTLAGPAYVSQALRPFERQRVPLEMLQDELQACEPEIEPERCSLLDALLGWGHSVPWEFPADMATFGG